MSAAPHTPRGVAWLTALGFAAALLAPGADAVLRPGAERFRSVEFRPPARRPGPPRSLEALASFPERYEAYFDDHFGLRDRLLRARNALTWFAFGLSPTPLFVRGREGWIFYTEHRSIEVQRGLAPLAPAELEAWRRLLEGRRDWLAGHGIAYAFALVPNKAAVYPERLPPGLDPVGPSRLDQLVRHLAASSDVRVLDLRDALRAERASDRPDLGDFVYHPLGTHWTERGAFAGYRALGERLREALPGLPLLPRERFELRPADDQGDSWAPRMYLEGLLSQPSFAFELQGPRRAAYDADALAQAFEASSRVPDAAELPRALVYHDSFGPDLRPWLAESFAEAEFRWTYDFDAEHVLATRPDVVVQVFVERVLVMLTPRLTPLEDPERLPAAFAASDDVRYALDPLAPDLAVEHAMRVEPGRDAEGPFVALVMSAGRDVVLPPPFALRPGELEGGAGPIVWLDLESPTDSAVDLFYETRREPGFDRSRALQVATRAGRNRLFVELPPVDLSGRLMLRPGRVPGTYALRALEVRVPTPGDE